MDGLVILNIPSQHWLITRKNRAFCAFQKNITTTTTTKTDDDDDNNSPKLDAWAVEIITVWGEATGRKGIWHY